MYAPTSPKQAAKRTTLDKQEMAHVLLRGEPLTMTGGDDAALGVRWKEIERLRSE